MKNSIKLMSGISAISIALIIFTFMGNFKDKTSKKEYKIIFLHHSTGNVLFNAGNEPNWILNKFFGKKAFVSKWFNDYNSKNGTNIHFTQQVFPKREPYGWNNYPYDYYNIWVKNAGDQPFLTEPTLEILTRQYNLIIFKHCFPVSAILNDTIAPDVNSPLKTIENYKLQYQELKRKMNEFPNNKFLVWTGAALNENHTNKKQALRTKAFFEWVKNEWDTDDDNIYVWDFYGLQTEGGLYTKKENVAGVNDSHPSKSFAQRAAKLFCERIIEIIE